jgi:hypothetical protein
MMLGLEMCLDELKATGKTPHKTTASALEYYKKATNRP